ncbi:hypothetical protein QWY28_13215 [Nocardioides sp. SOB77]|uniref:Uncharacterized protein n=1 Tax=Nocardioides oceani TaxID=3058369 RepID=A0ABT8FGV5_9ACTN|nr:hypothetical protein [Nocardioides oceani]MDN4173914.1 hypothetical protein [Nocardioides oceani]
MADRSVTVRLRLDTAQAIRNSKEFGDELGRAMDDAERSTRRSGLEIDRLSDRVRLARDAFFTLGPAAVPLTAAVVPALSAVTVGLGVTVAAAGTAALALVGMGDALNTLAEYQLAPTAENLEKVRLEMEKLGPDGAQFAEYLSSLEPQLRQLQDTARAGFLPGAEEGIEQALTALPRVNSLVAELSGTLGDLAADAGSSLAGSEFRGFFDYLDTDAARTLDELARSVGNFAQGFANIIVGLAPATRDFTGGLEESSQAFAEWSRGLEQNDSFQDFVAYIRESGPMAVDALAALAQAASGIVQAAAPLGQTVLPVLTALLEGLAAIASSDIGGPLFTGIAAMVAFNRASDLVTSTLTRLGVSIDRTGVSVQSTGSRFSKFGGYATGVAAVGMAVGMLADEIGRIDPANLDRAMEALQRGEVTSEIEEIADNIEYLGSKTNAIDLGEVVTAFGIFGDSTMDKYADNIEELDQRLARLVETGDSAAAAEIFSSVSELAQAKGADASDVAESFDAYALAVDNAAAASANAADDVRELGAAERMAAYEARNFAAGLAELNGWLDKRAALRGYRQSIDDLAAGLKNGFTREDADRLDNVARGISQVASQIKDKGLRADFLAGARASLERLANGAGPKAEAAISKVIGALDRYGLTKPRDPRLDVDNKPAQRGIDVAGDWLSGFGKQRAVAEVDVENGPALAAIATVKTQLGSIDRYIPVTVHVSRTGDGGGAGLEYVSGGAGADGMTVPGARAPYGDKVHVFVAPGEEVISNRHGQADKNRPALKAANRGAKLAVVGYASGGTVGYSADWEADWLAAGGGTGGRGGRGGGRPIDNRIEILRLQQSIADLTKSLNADGKNKISGLERRIAQAELIQARRELRDARNAPAAEAREARVEQRRNIRAAYAGFEVDADMSVEQIADEIADFRSQLREAGGEWTDQLRAQTADLLESATALELERERRDDLNDTLDEQKQALEQLQSTMDAYSESVARNFLRDGFNQGRDADETTDGLTPEASAAIGARRGQIAAAEADLAVIRSRDDGSVAAAAEASRLLAIIKRNQDEIEELGGDVDDASGDVAKPAQEAVSNLDALREILIEDTKRAQEMAAALELLAEKGLDTTGALGGLYQQLAASGDLETAQGLSELSPEQIDEYERLFTARDTAAAEVAALATQAVYGEQHAVLVEQVAQTTAAIAASTAAIDQLRAAVDNLGADVRNGASRGAAQGVAQVRPAIEQLTAAVQSIARQQSEAARKATP